MKNSNDEWKEILTPEQYHVLREKGTEPKFSGDLLKNDSPGKYTCAACGTALFSSETKYETGSGWPSFWDATGQDKITLLRDTSHGLDRIEVQCATCGSHLGHLFEDDTPTGKYYCINSVALKFEHEE